MKAVPLACKAPFAILRIAKQWRPPPGGDRKNWPRLNLIAARLNQSLQLSNTLPDALHALLEVVDAEFGAIHAIHDQRISLRAAHGLSDIDAQRLAGPDAPRRWYSSDLEIVREAIDEADGKLDVLLKALGIQVVVTVPRCENAASSSAC